MGYTGKLRTQEGRREFMQEVARIEQFLNDPWLIRSRENATVEVLVPKVVVSTAPRRSFLIPPVASLGFGRREEGATVKIASLAQLKKLESGDLVTVLSDANGEKQDSSIAKITCWMCSTAENEGSEGEKKMLSCSSCRRKYHQHCLKRWSQNRDLFRWSSWVCPSCRICEVCRKDGDPSKFMFCKRCDAAYHCYCQQPPSKNVGHGPYLCQKHTRCHSCSSSVPGSGLSSRWFLSYTCCDACGRLFVKGNYCTICLKVYRDSESTPMVCCDVCQRWVHCPCDGISDAKYMEFQANEDLQYACPACRGESSKISNLEEAVQELWRRRDEADRDLISSLRIASGWSTDEIFEILPYLDEGGTPVAKVDSGHSLKFSLKGFNEKFPKKGKEYGKKPLDKMHVKKKGRDFSVGCNTDHCRSEVLFSSEHDALSPITGSMTDTANTVMNPSRTIKMKTSKSTMEEIEVESAKPVSLSGKRLVIHLGGRSRTTSSPPNSNAASVEREQDMSFNGIGASFRQKPHDSIIGAVAPSGSFDNQVDLNLYAEGSISTRGASLRNKSSKNAEVSGNINNGSSAVPSISQVSTKTGKPLLKFKIPKYSSDGNETGIAARGSRDLLPLYGQDKLAYSRGQRSKRKKRPALDDDNIMNGNLSDTNWILLKLGKDASGKRVEIHQPSSDAWLRGTVVEVMEETSTVSVALDDGKTKSFELGKQGIQFVSKRKH